MTIHLCCELFHYYKTATFIHNRRFDSLPIKLNNGNQLSIFIDIWCKSHQSFNSSHKTYGMEDIFIKMVKDCHACQLSPMAIKKFVLRVNWVQKVKEPVNNLLLSMAPHVHRVRRGNTKKNMQNCKWLIWDRFFFKLIILDLRNEFLVEFWYF